MSLLVSGNYAHLSSAFEKFQSERTLALNLHSYLERWVVVWRSKWVLDLQNSSSR